MRGFWGLLRKYIYSIVFLMSLKDDISSMSKEEIRSSLEKFESDRRGRIDAFNKDLRQRAREPDELYVWHSYTVVSVEGVYKSQSLRFGGNDVIGPGSYLGRKTDTGLSSLLSLKVNSHSDEGSVVTNILFPGYSPVLFGYKICAELFAGECVSERELHDPTFGREVALPSHWVQKDLEEVAYARTIKIPSGSRSDTFKGFLDWFSEVSG